MKKRKALDYLQKNKLAALVVVLIFIILPIILWINGNKSADTSFLEVEEGHIEIIEKIKNPKGLIQNYTKELFKNALKPPSRKLPPKLPTGRKAIKYRAKQVIVRSGEESRLPIGTQIKGLLTSSINTLEVNGVVEALIPKAIRFNGEEVLPAKTLLLGTISYTGRGKVIEVQFERGVTSNGVEFEIAGRAQITGKLHSMAGQRIAKSVGLSAISDIASVLTEKESLGNGWGNSIERKSTLSNALTHATGEAARREAERQIETFEVDSDYLTVSSQKPISIRLMATFRRTF